MAAIKLICCIRCLQRFRIVIHVEVFPRGRIKVPSSRRYVVYHTDEDLTKSVELRPFVCLRRELMLLSNQRSGRIHESQNEYGLQVIVSLSKRRNMSSAYKIALFHYTLSPPVSYKRKTIINYQTLESHPSFHLQNIFSRRAFGQVAVKGRRWSLSEFFFVFVFCLFGLLNSKLLLHMLQHFWSYKFFPFTRMQPLLVEVYLPEKFYIHDDI